MTLLAMWALTTDAQATEIGSRPFGLGIQLGAPSGLSGKYYLEGRRNAIDFAVGAWYGDGFYDDFFAHATYSWHFPELTAGQGVAIPWRVGVGGWLASGYYRGRYGFDDLFLGARVPIGLDFDLETAPVQFFIEAALQLMVFPGIDAGLDAGLGVRYYF
jgi:hypothetical protein